MTEILILGAFAGFTIFLGLPVVLLRISDKKKGFLNALAIGILVFLIVDVFGHAWSTTVDATTSAFAGNASATSALTTLAAMFGGAAAGLLGLVVYENRYLGKSTPDNTFPAQKLATMIAIGIGAHNLSEGLAIGQSYASGAIGLAIILVVGFGAHNSTEGFGILAPLTGLKNRPKLSFVVRVLLIGGAPTFLGTVFGSVIYSSVSYVLFLSLAGGALVYVTMVMYNAGRKQASNDVLMLGVFLGLCAGLLTDLIVSLGGA